jgi:hypothetical protein
MLALHCFRVGECEKHVTGGNGHLLLACAQITDRVGTDSGTHLDAPRKPSCRCVERVKVALIAAAEHQVPGG